MPQPEGPTPAAGLNYEGQAKGAVLASETALETLHKTRPWALGFGVLLFSYAAVGGTVGLGWLAWLIWSLVTGPAPSRPFITIASVNLLFAPIAFAGAVRAIAYHRAVGQAYFRRNTDDLDRASIASRRLCVWAGAATIVLIAFPVCMVLAAILTGEWPG